MEVVVRLSAATSLSLTSLYRIDLIHAAARFSEPISMIDLSSWMFELVLLVLELMLLQIAAVGVGFSAAGSFWRHDLLLHT